MRVRTVKALSLVAACCLLTLGFNNNGCNGGGGGQGALDKICKGEECFSVSEFTQRMQQGLDGQVVGYALTVSANGLLHSEVGYGQRRTEADPPQKPFTTKDRINVASLNKTVTAVAVFRALAAKNFDLNTSIKQFLPSDWTLGQNVDAVTFRELLAHTSGFREDDGTALKSDTAYDDLKAVIARDLNPSNKTNLYQNHDFALFRIIIPYLVGFNEAGVTDKAAALSDAYLAYVNEQVFSPMSIKKVTCKPEKKNPPLYYPFPAGATNGTDFGDWTAKWIYEVKSRVAFN